MNTKVVRLNSELFPICEFEAALHRQQGYELLAVEANTPAAIIEHTADCDVLYVISTSLPTASFTAPTRSTASSAHSVYDLCR